MRHRVSGSPAIVCESCRRIITLVRPRSPDLMIHCCFCWRKAFVMAVGSCCTRTHTSCTHTHVMHAHTDVMHARTEQELSTAVEVHSLKTQVELDHTTTSPSPGMLLQESILRRVACLSSNLGEKPPFVMRSEK